MYNKKTHLSLIPPKDLGPLFFTIKDEKNKYRETIHNQATETS